MSVTYKEYTQYLVEYTYNNSNLSALQLRPLGHHGFIGGEIDGTKIMGLNLRSLVQEGLF